MSFELEQEVRNNVAYFRSISASELNNLVQCPGFMNEDIKGPAAEEGTKLHHAVETNSLEGLNPEQVELVTYCMKERDAIIARMKEMDPLCVVMTEKKSKLVEGLRNGIFDLIIVSPSTDRVAVIDYKFGYKEVPKASVNLQGYAYALGVFNQFPEKLVMMTFIHARTQTVDSEIFIKERDEDRLFTAVAEVFMAAQAKELAYNPGRSICSSCKNTITCPAVRAVIEKVAGVLLPDESVVTNNLDLATPAHRAACQKLVPILELWADKVTKSNLDAVVRQGLTIPGYKLTKRQGRRMATDISKLHNYLVQVGVDMSSFLSSVATVALSRIEKLVTKEQMEELERLDLVKRSDPSYYLTETK